MQVFFQQGEYVFSNLPEDFQMKTKFALATSAFLAASLFSLNSIAADDGSAKSNDGAIEKSKPKKSVKPHSHLDEKGVPHSDSASSSKRGAAKGGKKDVDKHLHSRDGK
jgi:hypothetical protein